MGIFKNQKGMTIIEVTVAMGIMGAAALGFATYQKNVAKAQSAQKVRATLLQLEMEATDYLKSRNVCNQNLELAFAGKEPLLAPAVTFPANPTGAIITGSPLYKELRSKDSRIPGTPITQLTRSLPVFVPDKDYDGGKIRVSDITYELNRIQRITVLNSPWDWSGFVKVSVEFERCRSDGAVIRVPRDRNGIINGQITYPCDVNDRIKVNKVFEKALAFKLNNNLIDRREIKQWVAGAFVSYNPPEWESLLTCADSQDAIVEQAASNTQLQACILQGKINLMTGKIGQVRAGSPPLPCDLTVTTNPAASPIIVSASNPQPSVPLPKTIVPGSLKLISIGGGGGGGRGGRNPATRNVGEGGKAGPIRRVDLPDYLAGKSCNITLGRGGAGGSGSRSSNNGDRGGLTSVTCAGMQPFEAPGGDGGGGGLNGSGGEDTLPYGHGGRGGRNVGNNGTNGAGGEGGAYNGYSGGTGGNGYVRFEFIAAVLLKTPALDPALDECGNYCPGTCPTYPAPTTARPDPCQ